MNEVLSEANFLLYCAKYYDDRHCSSTEEFYEDLKRIGYIKKLVTRYQATGDLKERLILNHIIVLNNVFGAEVTCRILYFRMKEQFAYIKPFLLLLDILSPQITNIEGLNTVNTDLIEMDPTIIEALRKI
jgi:hypothetical protein